MPVQQHFAAELQGQGADHIRNCQTGLAQRHFQFATDAAAGQRGNPGVGHIVGQRGVRQPRQGMIRGAAQHDGVFQQGGGPVDLRVDGGRKTADQHVHRARVQVFDQALVRADLDGERNARIGLAERSGGFSHRPAREHGKTADRQAAFVAARYGGQIDLGLAEVGQQQAGVTAHGVAQRRAGRALGRALEQARANQFFDFSDGARQARLRAVQLRRRFGQVAQFGDGQHDFQVPDAEFASERCHGKRPVAMCRLFSAPPGLATAVWDSDIVRRQARPRPHRAARCVARPCGGKKGTTCIHPYPLFPHPARGGLPSMRGPG
ncbi:hypothetical protein D3C72_1009220 [compost metagenome]